ncbi:MAG TPA: SIR2 family protein [Capsulimonadaceae bacterium]|jgi:hypothetical protein
MQMDPTLNLAISLSQKPRGVYAVLLGSGISRAATIPTGYEITLDLIRKIARSQKEDAGSSPEDWFRNKYNEAPRYDTLLKTLGKTPTERQLIIRSYIEPNDDERADGLKVPTAAHKALAKLVKDGYLRMILTTNFDRLMEAALTEEGVEFEVISGDDGIKGAIPYVHGGPVIVKLHGDYRDTRIKNISDELHSYSRMLTRYLDRVLDEFGLIVCGWSADWDTALRSAITRCPNRRFATYWLSKGEQGDLANELIVKRQANVIEIESADDFVTDLAEKVQAIDESLRPHPMSVPTAIATVERYLPNSSDKIRIDHLVRDEAQRLSMLFGANDRFRTEGRHWDVPIAKKRLLEYEEAGARYWSMLASISYYTESAYREYLTEAVEWLLPQSFKRNINQIEKYPSILSMYVVGVTAVAKSNYNNVSAVIADPIITDPITGIQKPAISELNIHYGMERIYNSIYTADGSLSIYSGLEPLRTFSDYLQSTVHRHVSHVLRRSGDFVAAYEELEFLIALTYLDKVGPKLIPYGTYYWSNEVYHLVGGWDYCPLKRTMDKHIGMGDLSPIITAGMFGGSSKHFKELIGTYTAYLAGQKD